MTDIIKLLDDLSEILKNAVNETLETGKGDWLERVVSYAMENAVAGIVSERVEGMQEEIGRLVKEKASEAVVKAMADNLKWTFEQGERMKARY